jgi:hypothetical protein
MAAFKSASPASPTQLGGDIVNGLIQSHPAQPALGLNYVLGCCRLNAGMKPRRFAASA